MLPETPSFWSRRGFIAYALLPLSWIYGAARCFLSSMAKPYSADIPVICIGGAVVGGSGKTPVLHAIADLITSQNLYDRPVILTRGYGGELKGPTKVDLEAHDASDVGDEAILHAARLPTIVSRDRAAGARLAQAMGADVILMDDGLQNTSLVKTMSFLVVDGEYGNGNGFLLPAGPLRETFKSAVKKSSAIIVTGGSLNMQADVPVLQTNLQIISQHDKSRYYYGFCGLGRPDKFKKTLVDQGFQLAGFKAFPDHHPYSFPDLFDLLSLAGPHRMITTEKDIVKIPTEYHDRIEVLCISLAFEEPEKIVDLLRSKART
jgi:tetraacyldisaccharide 4'-kinase